LIPNARNKRRALGVAFIFTVLLLSFETAIKYQDNYAVPWSPPSSEGLSELTWIRNHFGYDNLRTIIVVRDIASYLWVLDYDGGLIYYGNLFFLLKNQTDYSLLNSSDGAIRNAYIGSIQKLWSYDVLQNLQKYNYTVVVPVQLYQPDPIESQALMPLGPGIDVAKNLTGSMLNVLFNSWNLARSSRDMLGAASSLLRVSPLASCASYPLWTSISSSVRLSIGSGVVGSNCNVQADTNAVPQSTLYLQLSLSVPFDLANQSYVGFYFNGTTDSKGQSSLNVVFSSDMGFDSFFSYSFTDKSVWEPGLQGLLIPLFSFHLHGQPSWSSIGAIDVGVYSQLGGHYAFSFGEILVASPKAS
jgi:hypothetical protein